MKKILFLGFLLIVATPGIAQDDKNEEDVIDIISAITQNGDSVSAESSTDEKVATETTESKEPVTETQKLNNQLKTLLAQIETAQNKRIIATLKLKKNVTVHTKIARGSSISSEDSSIKVDIDSMYLASQNGFITDLIVYAGDYVFTNKVIIGLTKHRYFHNKDELLSQSGKKYIYYQDAVTFLAEKNYVADDDAFMLRNDSKSSVHYFKKGTDLKTALDLRVYTDALGVFSNNPNGIVQIDGGTKLLLHQSNIRGKSAFLFHYVKANINFSKFDSKQLNVTENEFSRSALIQKSWFNAGLTLNLFEGHVRQHFSTRYFVDAGGLITTSTLSKNNGDTVNVTGNNVWGELGISIKGDENYGFTVSGTILFNYSQQTVSIDATRNAPHVFFKPGVEAFYNPFSDETNRVFARVNYWMDTWNLSTQQNHFWQFQIGYNTTLSAL